MRVKIIAVLLFSAFLLSACAASTIAPTVVVTEAPFLPAPTSSTPGTYPNPVSKEPTANPYPAVAGTATSAYPAPGTPSASGSVIPPSGFEPQAADASLKRDEVFLELSTSQVLVTFGVTAKVEAILTGNLPDPCHSLRVIVTPADANNVISLEVYSIVDSRTPCTTVLQPFSARVPLGSYTTGVYKVTANGEPIGQFSAVLSPQPGDDQLTRAEVSIDISLSKLVMLGIHGNEETAFLAGNLPDPCHQLRIVLTPADAEKKINLEVYSVYDPQAVCAMVIVPFAVNVPLGKNPTGHYQVYVNGQLLGEFDK